MSKREKLEAALAMMPELIDKCTKKVALLHELKRSLAHEWAKEAGVADIEFTFNKFMRLKRAYEKAVAGQQTQFTFEGNDLLVSYAKYLIEYLEAKYLETKFRRS